jgi:DNA-binding response OmpR family regulator
MGQERILVVEDDRNARSALAEILSDEGFAVETAADGREALAKLGTFDPDVLLADVVMPELDGIALGKLAGARAKAPAVILMTACEDWWGHASNLVRKPIEVPRLLAAIFSALGRA